jgi:hypothetical protein
VGLQPHEKSSLQKGPFRPGLFDPPQIIAPKQICHPDPEYREGGRICSFFFEGARLQPCHQKSPKMRPGAPHPAFGMWDRRTVVRPALPGGSAGLSATKRGVHGMAFMPGLFDLPQIITPKQICHPDPEHREGGRICSFFFQGARLQPCHRKSPKKRLQSAEAPSPSPGTPVQHPAMLCCLQSNLIKLDADLRYPEELIEALELFFTSARLGTFKHFRPLVRSQHGRDSVYTQTEIRLQRPCR